MDKLNDSYENSKSIIREKWRSMRIDSREGDGGLTPFILLHRTLLLTAPPLLAPRCAAKLSRLRHKSSIRRPAPSSLVVAGGGREERRAGRRRTGQVGALSLFKDVFSILIGLSLHTVLKNHHSLEENHAFLNSVAPPPFRVAFDWPINYFQNNK